MVIRTAEKTDFQEIVIIYNHAVDEKFATADTEHVTTASWKNWFAIHIPETHPIFVAEENGEITGWCSLSPHRPGRKALSTVAEISYYVHKSHRRNGIANSLITFTLKVAVELGFRNLISILLDVNKPSIYLLEKFGFEKWGHLPNIAEDKIAKDNVQVGNIVQDETKESLRRSSRKNIGLSFGYLFPQDGYDNDDRSFTINLHLDYELQEMAAGMLLGIRDGFAMNVYGEYLFTQTDICPYAGGAFGFHWVTHSMVSSYNPYTNSYSEKKKGDGFELTLNTGLRVLHTYNFQILLNLEYIMTFNDYNDKAIVFTIGIL